MRVQTIAALSADHFVDRATPVELCTTLAQSEQGGVADQEREATILADSQFLDQIIFRIRNAQA